MYLESEVGGREGNGVEVDARLQVISAQHRNTLSKARLQRTQGNQLQRKLGLIQRRTHFSQSYTNTTVCNVSTTPPLLNPQYL